MAASSSDLLAPGASTTSSGFADGLGRRTLAFDREEGTMLERLVLRPELGAFEAMLRERVDRVAALEDERIARPRTIGRDADGSLVVVSEFVPGCRLSELLENTAETGSAPGVDAALGFLLDVLPALVGLHATTGFAHGTIAPTRTVFTPAGQIVLLDALYGSALSHLRYTRRKLWTDFGIAAPATAGAPRLDVQADIAQTALAAVMLVLGRPLRDGEYPDGLANVLLEVAEVAQIRSTDAFAAGLQTFLQRALALPNTKPYASADDALIDVREVASQLGVRECRRALLDCLELVESPRVEQAPAADDFDPILAAIDGYGLPGEPSLDESALLEEAAALEEGAALDASPDLDAAVDAELDIDALVDEASHGREHAEALTLDSSDSYEAAAAVSWTEPVEAPVAVDARSDNEPVTAPAIVTAAAPAPVAAVEEQKEQPQGGRSRRSKRAARSARSRKDKLLSAATDKRDEPAKKVEPAAKVETKLEPEPERRPEPEFERKPEPAPAEKPATPWLVAPGRAEAFEPAVSEPAPLPPAPPRPVAPPPPPAPYYPPLPSADPSTGVAVESAFSRTVAASSAPAGPIWSAHSAPPAPVPIPATPQLAQVKMKEAPKPRASRATAPVVDIYAPLVEAAAAPGGGSRRWMVAAAAAVVLGAGLFGAYAYWPVQGAAAPASAPPVATASEKTPVVANSVVAQTGRLEIETQPAGARILIDGKAAGESPVALDGIAAGRHVVTLISASGTVRRTIRIETGRTVKLDVPIFSGWVGIYAPFIVEVAEGGKVIGRTDEPRLMLSPGRHELTLTNKDLGYTSVQSVDIEPGEVRSISIDPRGKLNLNASPWAEVWIDDKKVGDTPIADLQLPLGIREVVFKHPEFGERRTTVTVKGNAPAAVSVDMSKPGN